jgi:hypothetical protein
LRSDKRQPLVKKATGTGERERKTLMQGRDKKTSPSPVVLFALGERLPFEQ